MEGKNTEGGNLEILRERITTKKNRREKAYLAQKSSIQTKEEISRKKIKGEK